MQEPAWRKRWNSRHNDYWTIRYLQQADSHKTVCVALPMSKS
jgi:hypothetical protein